MQKKKSASYRATRLELIRVEVWGHSDAAFAWDAQNFDHPNYSPEKARGLLSSGWNLWKRTKLTEIEHQPTLIVKPLLSMENPSINIEELIKEAPNHTINELAERYSTNYGTIYRILARYKVEAAKAYEPLTKEVLEAVFEQPTTIEEAAEQLHSNVGTVSYAIKKFGLFGGRKPTTKQKFNGGRAFKILSHLLHHPEENLASVGRRFNCTREYVRQVKESAIAESIIKQEIEPYEQ